MWQGVYRFDSLRAVNGEAIHSADPIRLGPSGTAARTGTTNALSRSAGLQIKRSLVSIVKRDGVFVIRGGSGAVLGAQPISIEIENVTLGTTVPVVAVGKDGEFETTVVAAVGDRLSMKALSAISEQVEMSLGRVPGAIPAGPAARGDVTRPAATPGLPRHPALRIEPSLISITEADGRFAVRGENGAVVGSQPISVEIKNDSLGTSVPIVAVTENGAFETHVVAVAGDRLSMTAVSGSGEQVGIALGQTPTSESQASLAGGHSVPVDRLHLVSNLLVVPAATAAAMIPRSSTQPRDRSRYPASRRGGRIEAVMRRVRRRARPRFKSFHATKDRYEV